MPGPQQRLEKAATQLALRTGKLAWVRAVPGRKSPPPAPADPGGSSLESQRHSPLFTLPSPSHRWPSGLCGSWGHGEADYPNPLGTHRHVATAVVRILLETWVGRWAPEQGHCPGYGRLRWGICRVGKGQKRSRQKTWLRGWSNEGDGEGPSRLSGKVEGRLCGALRVA